jgi:hypothetical protein
MQIRTGEFYMPRIALGISAIGASLLASAAVTLLPNQGMAFEMEKTADTLPGSTKFQDPDENLLAAPTNNGSLPLLKDDASDSSNIQPSGSTLQLAPGTTVTITGGAGPALGLQSGTPMGPVVDPSNPADNRSLIPAP